MMGEYYSNKFNLDFRSLRYPGVISSEKYAFNGTTDYSTEVFFHALENRYYKCPLKKETALPMIYIDDCVEATVKYLKADPNRLLNHVYNLAGISFTAEEFCSEVQKLIPGTVVDYVPDIRQDIAEQWPKSIDDTLSRIHWNWEYKLSTYELAEKILTNIDRGRACETRCRVLRGYARRHNHSVKAHQVAQNGSAIDLNVVKATHWRSTQSRVLHKIFAAILPVFIYI